MSTLTKSSSEFLTREEEQRLARRWRDHQDPKARERIVRAYRKMAVGFAMRAVRPGLHLDDLVQEAVMGLMSALDRFDPELGFAFATFARYHVISRLQIYTLENVGPVRIFNTGATKALLGRYYRLRRALERDGQLTAEGRARICKELELTDDELQRFEMAVAVPVTIDTGAGHLEDPESGGSRAKTLASDADGPDSTAFQTVGREQAARILAEILASLPERDARIVRERHLQDPPSTLDKLSIALGISRERVRQIELRTLKKIREALKARGIASVGEFFD